MQAKVILFLTLLFAAIVLRIKMMFRLLAQIEVTYCLHCVRIESAVFAKLVDNWTVLWCGILWFVAWCLMHFICFSNKSKMSFLSEWASNSNNSHCVQTTRSYWVHATWKFVVASKQTESTRNNKFKCLYIRLKNGKLWLQTKSRRLLWDLFGAFSKAVEIA